MKKLLVVVDYQNDFVTGALGFPGADKIEPEIISLINKFFREEQDVVFTKDTHGEDYLDTEEGQHLPVKHCIKGSWGHELTDNLLPLAKDRLVIEKPTFGSLELGNYIKNNNYDEIYLCGLVSDICVFTNALICKSSCSINSKIYVIRNATSSFDLSIQEASFELLKHLHINVI